MLLFPKPSWAQRCGLLHLTVLLSLAGLRVDLDLYLLLPPPPPLLRAPGALLGGPGSAAHARPPFRGGAVGGWSPLPPKGRAGQRLLREVRTLGVPFIPRTHVDAWLVHRVAAAGGADGPPRLLGSAAPSEASGAGGPGASGGGGGAVPPTPARGEDRDQGPEEAQPPTAAAAPGSGESGGRAVEQSNVDETDTTLSLEDVFPLMLPPVENSLEGISDLSVQPGTGMLLGDSVEDRWQDCLSPPELQGISSQPMPFLCNSLHDEVDSPGQYSVNLSQAISQDVSLHEAMLLCPDGPRRDPRTRNPQTQETLMPFNSSSALPLTGTDWAEYTESRTRNLTAQDLLFDFDENIFDEINLMSLATEEGFDPMEVPHLFVEPDSDSGLSLNSSHSSTSGNPSNSPSVCDREGAVGYSSDAEPLSHQGLEGAVGGQWPETAELCQKGLDSSRDPAYDHVLHNHTYYLLPSPPSSEHLLSWPLKSQRVENGYLLSDRDSSQDEHCAKMLHLPFSADEIVSMPVESFNNMLARNYLSDTQVSLLRDIRRRGKNKVAAQNCRKRKLDVILSLEEDVGSLRAKRESLKRERAQCSKSISLMKQKLQDLCRDVFSRLRDDQGRPVNPNLYVLHCGQDGSILVVPKELVTSGLKKENPKEKGKK